MFRARFSNPFFSLAPKAFRFPNEFIPERWTTRGDLILNKKACIPFSYGRFSCKTHLFVCFQLLSPRDAAKQEIGIGKNLALNELRTVIAKAVLEFDIAFAPGETGKSLLTESKDIFTMALAKLELRFTKRSPA